MVRNVDEMVTPKVSVVVPLYNSDRYIEKCLESLMKQSVFEYEVIVVDDGSNDNSKKIVENFINSNGLKNFYLISTENRGVSSARNTGIEESKGEWLTFVDADDWVDEDYLKSMLDALKIYNADFCVAGVRKYFELISEYRESYSPKFIYGSRENTIQFLSYPSPVSRLYSREIIISNNIRFDTRIRVGEDRAFNYEYLCYVEKCVIVNEIQYVYRINSNSVTQKSIVPSYKKHLFEPAKRFWTSFTDPYAVENAFSLSYHFAQSIVDSLLWDLINAILEKREDFFRIVNDSFSIWIVNNYCHKCASFKEKFLVFLLKHRLYFLTRVAVKFYYQKTIRKVLKSII